MENKDLDKFLAEKVMGWKLYNIKKCVYNNPHLGKAYDDFDYWCDKPEHAIMPSCEWHPTTSISDAFQVVEKIRKDWLFSKRKAFLRALQGQTSQQISTDEIVTIAWPDVFFYITPLTICLAAKKAIEGEGE